MEWEVSGHVVMDPSAQAFLTRLLAGADGISFSNLSGGLPTSDGEAILDEWPRAGS